MAALLQQRKTGTAKLNQKGWPLGHVGKCHAQKWDTTVSFRYEKRMQSDEDDGTCLPVCTETAPGVRYRSFGVKREIATRPTDQTNSSKREPVLEAE